MKKKTYTLTERETELMVSVINAIIEKKGYDVDELGLGYTDDKIVSFDGESLELTFEWILGDLLK